ncbi:hypothetical protein ACQP0C_41585 (plasmid) [Nocardia sp. CA-129566]|uniref:hypothetical protein n=1 Tax=Nocardia sp. CA-129566 TaxID=3239976 RepID=UPI003D99DC72
MTTDDHLTNARIAILRKLDAERTDHDIRTWTTHYEQLDETLSMLQTLETTVDGLDNTNEWPTLDHSALIALLQKVAVLRERLDLIEITALEAAQHAGVPWERVDSVYAPVSASAAKQRYLDLTVRHNGISLFGFSPDDLPDDDDAAAGV